MRQRSAILLTFASPNKRRKFPLCTIGNLFDVNCPDAAGGRPPCLQNDFEQIVSDCSIFCLATTLDMRVDPEPDTVFVS